MKKISHEEPIAPLRYVVEKLGWKRLADYDRCYYASPTDGTVYSVRKSDGRLKELKGTSSADGYLTIKLKQAGRYITKRVNRLIAQAFVPNPENKPIAHHIDHNRQNNKRSNLAWATTKENRNK